MVAAALGHESVSTTHKHYTDRSAVSRAKQERLIRALKGGRMALG